MKAWAEMTERERDVLVFTKGFGCSEPEWRDGEPWYPWTESVKIPHFSTDRAAAMTLLDGFDAFQLWKELSGVHGCELTNAETKSFIAEGDTMPESICKAFLRSKDVKFG